MSIYIKGMEMPTTCFECPFMFARHYCCADLTLDLYQGDYEELKGRVAGCPLVPVPEHGRLIDADALVNANEKTYDNLRNGDEISTQEATIAYLLTNEIIQRAKTIIPAEEGEG